MKLASVPKPKLRLSSRRRLSSGFAVASSRQTKSGSATAATSASRTMKGEPNQSSLLPSSSTVSSAPSPTASMAMPSQSPCFKRPSCIGARSSEGHSIASITTPGARLT